MIIYRKRQKLENIRMNVYYVNKFTYGNKMTLKKIMKQNLIKYEIKDIPNTSYLEKLRIKK